MSTAPRRGVPGLTRERIVAAALDLGDARGLAGVSMRRVAEVLGCDPMALYWHVRNKEDLLDAVADTVLAELVVPASGDWPGRLRATCLDLRRILLAHPAAAQRFATRPPLGPHAVRACEAVLGVLGSAGTSPAGAARLLQTLVSYTVGAVAQELATPSRAAATRTDEVRRTLGGLSPTDFPLTAAAAGHLVSRTGAEAFAAGLDLILAGARRPGVLSR
ncbi:MAG: TetR/AcrR family transcriptional regulator C-terminal domain-containing protein [Kineosporiaceae bacterium]